MKVSSTREIADKNATEMLHSGLRETPPLGEKAGAEEICAQHLPSQRLLTEIFEELSKFNSKKIIILIKKEADDWPFYPHR